MNRYYFHTIDNDLKRLDPHGDECDSRDEIKTNAIGVLVGMAQDELPDGEQHHFAVEVTDQNGDLVFSAELDLKSRWVENQDFQPVEDDR